MLPQSLESARHLLRKGHLKAFSFDIFDTIVFRRCATPDGVFERAFQLSGLENKRPGLAKVFLQHRQLAEGFARKTAEKERGFKEVTIEEIYQSFAAHIFGLGRQDFQRLAEAEFQAELDLCFGNRDIAALITEMRQAGLRVGFLSDTYWNAERLTTLLRSCLPGLEWDFLYASCDQRTAKGEGLFGHYLNDQKLDAKSVAHLGDNPAADVASPTRQGIAAIAYPQGHLELAPLFQREALSFSMMCHQAAIDTRQDGGLRTLRRAIDARQDENTSAPHRFGSRCLGPVFTAFSRLAERRRAELVADGGQVGMAFLARDGLLPFEVWRQLSDLPASYIEVNRRIALIGGSTNFDPLVAFFEHVPQVNRDVVRIFLKTENAATARFFQSLPPPAILRGLDFAEKVPELIGQDELDVLAKTLRGQVLAHLRASIPNFDTLTDLMLVDLGYSGTVQKALQTILRCEGISLRLHGVYLVTADEALRTLAEGDTAIGLLNDLVMAPATKRVVLSNIALLEQVCSAPVGSVRQYNEDGSVQREDDPRSAEQKALCAEVRAGALAFAAQVAPVVANGFADPFADLERVIPHAASILARALLFPTDDELATLGGLKHDVNLGSQALAPMADPEYVQSLLVAKSLPSAYAPHEPPMWMAGSLAGLSPALGFLYLTHGAGLLSADALGEAACGEVEVLLLNDRGATPVKAVLRRDGLGELRLRLPILQSQGIAALAIPLAPLPARGRLLPLSLQQGRTVNLALKSVLDVVPVAQIEAAGATIDRGLYFVTDPTGHLVAPLPRLTERMALVSIGIVPLDASRILVSAGGEA